ncbi:MAG: STAS/SEC14 domain-containing protein [Sulfitobacter sp.]|nr:STAS/SEC14 domain-containing protein [Sulfitobacter sp.]
MLEITKVSERRLDIALSGAIDGAQMTKGLDDLIRLSRDLRGGRMLYTITDFRMPSWEALAVEMTRLPALFGLLGKYDRCAVLSDTAWLRRAAEMEGAVIPGLEIKSFDLGQQDAAEAWLEA